jgi:DNA-binding IclR family transcriptional regulator
VSRRDLAHVLTALAELSGEQAGVGVAVGDIDAAVGRTPGDMRSPLNLGSLAAEGLVEQLDDGRWALTPAGLERHRQDEAYESR